MQEETKVQTLVVCELFLVIMEGESWSAEQTFALNLSDGIYCLALTVQ